MILAIESSCDESALALFDPAKGVVDEWVHSQLDLHREYGGVVPDIASRQHLEHLPKMLDLIPKDKTRDIKSIAVTCGPGLAGCLALGVATAKSIALALDLPLLGANHMRGHAWSPFIDLHASNPTDFDNQLKKLLPHLGLIASGGHTILFQIDRERRISILAETVDDAAGEALDKGAKLMGLDYPGGPAVEKCAKAGNPKAFKFPRAFPSSSEFKFSFSGLKTSLRYTLEKINGKSFDAHLADICASYQEAVIDQLTNKTTHVLKSQSFASLGLSGGVANNCRLRERVSDLGKKHSLPVFCARPQHSGDNAAMIAFAAHVNPDHLKAADKFKLSFHPSLGLSS